jgi:proline dehydrogenase
MLRSLLLAASRQRWLGAWMEKAALGNRLIGRFVAGRAVDDGVAVAERLAAEGILTTLDHLGENVTSPEEARASAAAYLEALDRIAGRRLPTTVSIKLTQFGLDLSEEICRANVRQVVERARERGTAVEIDMESSAYTDRTLAIVGEMHASGGAVRAVIQSYLRRSGSDVDRLSAEGIPVRLCKGAYREPPEVAFPRKRDVDRRFLELARLLLERGRDPAFATHDERLMSAVIAEARLRRVPRDGFEIQMLYGIRARLQRQLAREGFRVRLYVPYGVAWYPYFMRRLAERPANLWFVLRSLMRP